MSAVGWWLIGRDKASQHDDVMREIRPMNSDPIYTRYDLRGYTYDADVAMRWLCNGDLTGAVLRPRMECDR